MALIQRIRFQPACCPYCRAPLGGEVWRCDRCGTKHHAECALETRRCTVFGCRAPVSAPGRLVPSALRGLLDVAIAIGFCAALPTFVFLPVILAAIFKDSERGLMAGMVLQVSVFVSVPIALAVRRFSGPRRR